MFLSIFVLVELHATPPSITCSYLVPVPTWYLGLVTCTTPPAGGPQQLLISFPPSLTCSLSVSPSLKWGQQYPLERDIVTVLEESCCGHPQHGNWNGEDGPERDSLLRLPWLSLPSGVSVVLSVKW